MPYLASFGTPRHCNPGYLSTAQQQLVAQRVAEHLRGEVRLWGIGLVFGSINLIRMQTVGCGRRGEGIRFLTLV